MNRRDFLARASLIAAGAVAADQMELIDRLGWKRSLFALGAPDFTPFPANQLGALVTKRGDVTFVMHGHNNKPVRIKNLFEGDLLPIYAKGFVTSQTTAGIVPLRNPFRG